MFQPAHVKACFLGSNLTVPVSDGKLNLGTWQGVWLCEHRDRAGSRKVIMFPTPHLTHATVYLTRPYCSSAHVTLHLTHVTVHLANITVQFIHVTNVYI
jgi:hypothetical protein